MRRFVAGSLVATLAGAALAAGCGPTLASHIRADQLGLGRVVVYRNGVAYYERKARVHGGTLTVHVPRDRVDDFLKSLTVVDMATGQPLPVAFPRQQSEDGATIEMTLQVPARTDDAEVRLTYVTEAPAWKPSYRLAMRDDGGMMLEAWAVVDNVSGEDWDQVEVGVGSSAAMSFRYDLWGVRTVDRAELSPAEQFAVAPPTGVSPYDATPSAPATVIDLDASELRAVNGDVAKNVPVPGRAFGAALGAAAGAQGDDVGVSFSGSSSLENQYEVDGATASASGSASASATGSATGEVRGRVTDKRTGEPVAGVTVAATVGSSTATAISGEDGTYTIGGLAPGRYRVAFFYGAVTVEHKDVDVRRQKATPVFQKLDTEAQGGEVVTIESRTPTIDTSSTSQGMTIDRDYTENIPEASGGYHDEAPAPPPPPDPAALARAAVAAGDQKLAGVVPDLIAQKAFVTVEGYAGPGETEQEALARANLVRNQLIDAGVAPARVRAVSKGLVAGHAAGVQLVTGTPGETEHGEGGQVGQVAGASGAGAGTSPAAAAMDPGAPPVGESYFLSPGEITVGAGTSAMVSVLRAPTAGKLVYLYDPSSQRGNQRFAFRAVRLTNPTDATLEPGPITVYGQGRYVGEGLTEPILPRAAAVVPFALDRQVVVERESGGRDRLQRLASIQRGVLTADVQHVRTTELTLTSRLAAPTTVYVRHPVTAGWTLVDPPGDVERIGDAYLIAIDLPAGATRKVELAEETPTVQVLDLSADPTLSMLAVFVASDLPSPALKARLATILDDHRALVDGAARIELLRQRIDEYRVRGRELEGQILDLRKVKGAAELQHSLQQKLDDTATRGQQATLDLVAAQEQLMLDRIRFADALADLPDDEALATATP
ncbi:MAG TPA: carboxypeptidase regulatory-like domain-containing protein [Kofleriaceae bacterium]|nr:carboxypeptidase regulatory-like domain-containing protein [Kofleriaceae bacterium]